MPDPVQRTRDPLHAAIAAASKWSRTRHVAISLIVMITISAIDLTTGPYMSLGVFQLIPLGLVGWFVSRRWAVALATIAGATAYLDARQLLAEDLPSAVFVWNCVSRVGLFLAVAWMVSALRSMYDHQRTLAETDDVTGMPNRRAFAGACEREIARAARTREPLSVIYLDADHFKSINDRYGHATGDRLLRIVAGVLSVNSRRSDFVARLGGDEFVVLLPGTDLDGAGLVADKFKLLLNESMMREKWPVTFSMGVATFTKPPENADDLIRKADALQYAAKHGGRNAIVNEHIAA